MATIATPSISVTPPQEFKEPPKDAQIEDMTKDFHLYLQDHKINTKLAKALSELNAERAQAPVADPIQFICNQLGSVCSRCGHKAYPKHAKCDSCGCHKEAVEKLPVCGCGAEGYGVGHVEPTIFKLPTDFPGKPEPDASVGFPDTDENLEYDQILRKKRLNHALLEKNALDSLPKFALKHVEQPVTEVEEKGPDFVAVFAERTVRAFLIPVPGGGMKGGLKALSSEAMLAPELGAHEYRTAKPTATAGSTNATGVDDSLTKETKCQTCGCDKCESTDSTERSVCGCGVNEPGLDHAGGKTVFKTFFPGKAEPMPDTGFPDTDPNVEYDQVLRKERLNNAVLQGLPTLKHREVPQDLSQVPDFIVVLQEKVTGGYLTMTAESIAAVTAVPTIAPATVSATATPTPNNTPSTTEPATPAEPAATTGALGTKTAAAPRSSGQPPVIVSCWTTTPPDVLQDGSVLFASAIMLDNPVEGKEGEVGTGGSEEAKETEAGFTKVSSKKKKKNKKKNASATGAVPVSTPPANTA